MSLTNEITRIGAEFEAAQAARLTAIGAIEAAVAHDLQNGRTTRSRVMAAHEKATKSGLKEIFGAAAFLRGAADDLIDRFADDHEKKGEAMRQELRSFVEELQETVAGQMQRLVDRRTTTARQEETARRAYLKDLRRRVHAVIGSADNYMKDLHKDRTTAERVWEQHRHASRRIRHAAAPPTPMTTAEVAATTAMAEGETAARKRTAKAKKPSKAAKH